MPFTICRSWGRAAMVCMPDGSKKYRFAIVIFVLLLTACRQKMADQPRYDPYDESTFFADRLSARPLPVGAIPRDFPTRNELLDRGTINGKPADRFPFPITMDILHRGREQYDIYC